MSCVYALVLASAPDDYRYVGRTSYPVDRRLSDHWSQARSGRNTHQYKWMRKALLEGEVVQVVMLEDSLSHEESVEREIYYIKKFREKGHRLTNATDGGEGVLGQVVSLETREKLRQANLGNKISPETRAKISDALKGRKQSKEHVEKSRQVRLGHAVSAETRVKIGLAGRGRKASIETRKKISEANKGKQRTLGLIHTEETKSKISSANKGRALSPETRANISASRTGIVFTPEHRKNISAASKKAWEIRKAKNT